MVGDIFFKNYKMNEIVNQLLLAGNKFMAEKRFMHLKQPGFICSACGTFTKNN